MTATPSINPKVDSPNLVAEDGSFNKYLPVKIGSKIVLALVDSGNGIQNVISCDLAEKLKLGILSKYQGPNVGTAKKGQPFGITGVLNNVKLQMMDSLGTTHNFTTPF